LVDRLKATPLEAVYRVFDPRSNQEAVLRHLTEAALRKSDRAEEFRQGFSRAASLRHPSVAATWEVLEFAGRPAVLQEYISGVPSSDGPALAAAPGVWYRLVSQAAFALQAVHQVSQVHAHLDACHIVLTTEGIVKVCGFGEPRWLWPAHVHCVENPTPLDDL